MTVSTTNNRNLLTADGVVTEFTYTFYTQSTGDITVYQDGVLQASGFTLARNTNGNGGTVTFSVAPANGVKVLILRSLALTQGTDLPSETNLPEQSIEDMSDKATMLVQQLQEIVDRCAKLGITSDGSVNMEMSAPVGLNVLRWNAAGDALEHVSPAVAYSEAVPDAGLGDVVGPSSPLDNALALFDGTSGDTLKALASLGAAGEFLKSQGVGLPPVFAALPGTTDSTPSGAMVLWPFAFGDIPAGWEAATGQTVTINTVSKTAPDMRGFGVIGASDGDPAPANGGFTGADIVLGATSGSLTHVHTQQGTFATGASAGPNNANIGSGAQTQPQSTHTHNVTVSGDTAATDSKMMSKAFTWIIKVD